MVLFAAIVSMSRIMFITVCTSLGDRSQITRDPSETPTHHMEIRI